MSGGGLALDTAAWASPWRERAVRDKTVLAGGLLACALFLPPWPGGLGAGLAAAAVMLGPGRVAPSLFVRCLLVPALFITIGAATVLVSVAWAGWGTMPQLAVTPQTVYSAQTVAVRGLAGTCAVFVLATTTPMVDLLAALRRLRIPDACIEVASLTYRLVFVLLESAHTIHQAQSARLGYANRRAALRSAASAVAAVLTSAWDRARRLEDGLAGRGYVDALPTLDPVRRSSARFVALSVAGVGLLAAVSLWVGIAS